MRKHFRIAYHQNIHFLPLFSFTLGIHFIENGAGRNYKEPYAGVTHSSMLLPYEPKCRFIGNWQPKISYLITNKAAFWRVREQYAGMCDPGVIHPNMNFLNILFL